MECRTVGKRSGSVFRIHFSTESAPSQAEAGSTIHGACIRCPISSLFRVAAHEAEGAVPFVCTCTCKKWRLCDTEQPPTPQVVARGNPLLPAVDADTPYAGSTATQKRGQPLTARRRFVRSCSRNGDDRHNETLLPGTREPARPQAAKDRCALQTHRSTSRGSAWHRAESQRPKQSGYS